MTLPVTGALFAAAALAVLVDQASKVLAERVLADRRCDLFGQSSGFRWVLNRRGSLVAVPLRWAFVIWIGLLAGSALFAVEEASVGVVGAVGLGLALGGATSNLADRVVRGAVADFIAVGRWPMFNLADGVMVAGTGLLAAGLS
jgi:signal peptidase II